jgi:hypothetical protein
MDGSIIGSCSAQSNAGQAAESYKHDDMNPAGIVVLA